MGVKNVSGLLSSQPLSSKHSRGGKAKASDPMWQGVNHQVTKQEAQQLELNQQRELEEAQQLALTDAQTLEQQNFAARLAKTNQTKASELPNLSQEDLAKAVQQNDPDAMFIAAVISMKGKKGDINAIGKLLKQALNLYQQGVAKGDPHAAKMSAQVGQMLKAITKPQQAQPQLSLPSISGDGTLPMPQMTPQMQQAMLAHFAQQGGMPHNSMGTHVPHEMNGRMISAY